jgi:hypothetical protein
VEAEKEWEEWAKVKDKLEVKIPPPTARQEKWSKRLERRGAPMAPYMDFSDAFPFRYMGLGNPVPTGGQKYMQAGLTEEYALCSVKL